MPITVRPATTNDIPALMALLVQVNMVHHNGRPDLFKGPTTKYTEAELAAILADPTTPVFVGVDGADRVLGHGFCVMQHSGGRLMEAHDTLYIDDICVAERYRRHGIATALFERCIMQAREAGCRNIELGVYCFNGDAVAFYGAMGMLPVMQRMELRLEETESCPKNL